jgi:hypothetical protein
MAIIYRKGLIVRKLTVLVYFLPIVFFQEIALYIADHLRFSYSSAVVYNIYRPICTIVFASIYYKVPFMSSLKKWIAWLTIAYLCIILVSYVFLHSFFSNNTYLILCRGVLLTFCAILFLFRYFTLDNLIEEKFWRPLVWITAGIAVFYPVVTLSVTFEDYLSVQDTKIFGFRLYNLAPQIMSIFMYSCFSHAFYLCRKRN